MKIKLFICTILIWSFIGCSQDIEVPDNNSSDPDEEMHPDWLVPKDAIIDGGPGKDGIPSIDNPKFSKASEFSIMQDDDIIIVLKSNNTIKAYPHRILDWHEIVNDQVENEFLSITYCPLTGTTLVWDRILDGKPTTFGVSGLLYNSNLIPYDRATDSYWSQMLQKSIHGEMISATPIQYPAIEMSWKTFKSSFPDAQVLNTNTGRSRNYNIYPYGDYKTNDNYFLFPTTKIADGIPQLVNIPQKERVLTVSVFEDNPAIFRFDLFPTEGGIVEGELNGKKFLVAGNPSQNYMVAFKVNEGGWEYLPNDFPYVVKDPLGNKYNFFGESNGLKLELYPQVMGYWFIFPVFYKSYHLHKG